MVKIRLEGTSTEVQSAVKMLGSGFDLLSVSGEYPNRGRSKYVRIYIDAEIRDIPAAETTEENTL